MKTDAKGTTAAKPGFHTVTPMITAEGADKVIQFLKQVFDAVVVDLLERPDGKVAHATVAIGDSIVMIGEAGNGPDCAAALANLYVYVADADATYGRALKAGGSKAMEPADMFWGDRYGAVKDQTGNTWGIATHIEEVEPAELRRRAAAFMGEQAAAG